MRIGIGIGEISGAGGALDTMIAEVQRAEQDGFASAWFANIFGVDAITFAALCGRVTQRIELGTAVVPTFPRHPVAMAQQALTAQAAAGGRFTLGIGLSHQVVIETMLGLSFARPFSHMQEYMAVLAPLIRDGSANFEGGEFRVHASVSVPGARPCPILLAALAPRMLALAGRVGDGTITWMTGPKTLREYTVPRITEAASTAGRPAPRIVAGMPVAVTEDAAGARAAAAQQFQIYGALPSYRAMLDREGAAAPEDIAIIGDESAVSERIAQFAAIGVTDFLGIPYAFGPDKRGAIERTRALLVREAKRAGR